MSVALYAFIRAMREENEASYGWAALCGAATGVGLLSKYAILYFVLGMALSPLILAEGRRPILSFRGILIAFIAVAIFVPNILWNTTHGFATAAHTAANADWQRGGIRSAGALEFLVGQFGVFGPLMMVPYLYALWSVVRREDRSPAVCCWLASPRAPLPSSWSRWPLPMPTPIGRQRPMWRRHPLRRHADGRGKGLGALTISLALNSFVMAALMVFTVSPPASGSAGFANAYKRLEGWRELGAIVAHDAA